MMWLSDRLRQRWTAWWQARLPRQDALTLTQRNIYILPSRAGWSFAALLLVLLAASINEQVNLGYGLTFLLGSTALAVLYQTHANLQGVSLSLQAPRSVHAGQSLSLTVVVHNPHPRRERLGLRIGTRGADMLPVEVAPGQDSAVEIDLPTGARGWQALPALTIETAYPMGFFRAWAYWRPLSQVLIWPALDPNAPPLPEFGETDRVAGVRHTVAHNTEMPQGLRPYRRGDPLRWIAWKKSTQALASGTGLVSREATQGRAPDLWLDYETSAGLTGLAPEARLSRLASWLIEAEQAAGEGGAAYGLRLPGRDLDCGLGTPHLRACLDALAEWGSPTQAGTRA